jgi:hypothetical protein
VLLDRGEFPDEAPAPAVIAGEETPEPGTIQFTYCGVPVRYRPTDGSPSLRVRWSEGRTTEVPGSRLDAETSAAVFARRGRILGIEAAVRPGRLVDGPPAGSRNADGAAAP